MSSVSSRCVIKISGESLRVADSCYSPNFIKNLSLQIKELVDQGIQPILIPGGGNICRGEELAPMFDIKKNLSHRIEFDYAGMLSTLVNGIVLKTALNHYGNLKTTLLTMIKAPCAIAENYTLSRASKALASESVLIIAGGIGQPDFSSDVGVFSKARELEAKLILIGKNKTDGVYSKDPRHDSTGVFVHQTTFSEVLQKKMKIIDMAAAAIGLTNNFKVRFFDISQPNAIVNAFHGKGIYSDVQNS